MMESSVQLFKEPEAVHAYTKKRQDFVMKLCDEMCRHKGLPDGWALCSDYCLNLNPFYSRDLFA